VEHFPEAIETITRIHPFHVSALGFADSCLLRAAVPSSDVAATQALPHGPAAELGTISHSVLAELTVRDLSETELSDAVESLLENQLAHAEERLSKEPRHRRYADLRSTKTSLQWQAYKAGLIRSASLSNVRPKPAAVRLDNAHRRESPEAIISGVERGVSSEKLDLTGRIDRIVRGRNGETEIVDYKTKLKLDALGDVPKEVRIQLELYGLLVAMHEHGPSIRLRVSVIGGGEFQVPLGDQWKLKRLEWLKQLAGRVPKNVEVRADELAVPSPNCVGCHIRHQCSSYLEAAPSAWKQRTLAIPWPLDTWGDVIKVDIAQGGQLNILLRDAAGRLVRVTGLLSAFVESPIRSGDKLWCFSLHTGKPPQTSTATPHPANFFETPTDRRGKRAYSLAVFKE
jgi:hypothetical protein